MSLHRWALGTLAFLAFAAARGEMSEFHPGDWVQYVFAVVVYFVYVFVEDDK